MPGRWPPGARRRRPLAAALALCGVLGAGASEAPADAISLLQGSLTQGAQRHAQEDSKEQAGKEEEQAGKGTEGGIEADPLANVTPSAQLHKWLVEEEAKRNPAKPWFFSPRLDGAQLGLASRHRQVLPELALEKRKSDWLTLSRLAAKPAQVQDWPVSLAARDPADLGRIFFKEPCLGKPGWFHLRTVFGRYVNVNPDGRVSAHKDHPFDGGSRFMFVPHPIVKGRVCWLASNGECVGNYGDAAGKAFLDVHKPDKDSNGTVAQVQEIPDVDGLKVLVTFDSSKHSEGYVVTAAISKAAMAQWSVLRHDSHPFETSMYLADYIPAHERRGRLCGLVAGLIIGGFLFLFTYNLHFALTDKSAAPKARLPNFDVARFILETLVIHAHLVLIGLLAVDVQPEYMSSFRMPAFMLISGIFGANMAYESVSKLLCCTVGTLILMVFIRLVEYRIIWGPEHVLDNLGKNFHLDVVAPGLWFLPALAGMRLLVSPLFHFARKLNVRTVAPFLFVKLASYCVMHWTKGWNGWILSAYLWHNFLAFAPFFALGMLWRPAEWDAFLQKRWVQASSIAYFTAWYLLILSPGFLQWNSSYCLPVVQKKGCYAHYDPAQVDGPMNIETFLLDLVFFGLRVGISVSFMGVVFAVCEVVGLVMPRLIELMAGWGSRTLYAYVIHIHAFTVLHEDGNFYFGSASPGVKWPIDVIVPVLLNAVLSSQGSERWFRWLLMPFWLKDLLEGKSLGCTSAASRLALWAKQGKEPAG